MEIYLLTKNKGKLSAARNAFAKYGIVLNLVEKEFPEIQALTSGEIARAMALQAANKLKVRVIREDHSLYIKALSGFPGPYISYFNKTISAQNILDLIKDKDRSGYFEIAAAYAKPNQEVKEYSFRIKVDILKELKGNRGNWERFLAYSGDTESFSEKGEDADEEIWNKNFLSIAQDILGEITLSQAS